MATNEEDVRAEARRVWPNAKEVLVRPSGSELVAHKAWRVDAIDYDDKEIGGVTGRSLDELKQKLEGMQPPGGQAP